MKEQKQKKSGGGIIFFVIIAIAVWAYAGGYGFSSGGGSLKVFSDESTVTIDGDDNSVVSIAGNRNSAELTHVVPEPETRGGAGSAFLGLVMVVLLITTGMIVLNGGVYS